MRCLLKVRLDTEAGNQAITDGTLPKVIQQVMDRTNPEACYFTAEDGDRTAFIFFDMSDASDMPMLAEPLFGQLKAKITLTPVMNLDDLQKGLAKLS